MKKAFKLILIASFLFTILLGCASTPVKKEIPTRTYVGEVIGQKGVLVGEYAEGAKVVTGNIAGDIITWEGFKLNLRAETGEIFEYLSRDLYYEGDGILITAKGKKVLKIKNKP
ncbi:MAG: hypothetical protein PF574_02495 [Candidatus Delongbacteria bacterium]|jgi:hypothetical protein|nr:hypothetical protein [Candidatus Delongbacteria bacterium]